MGTYQNYNVIPENDTSDTFLVKNKSHVTKLDDAEEPR